MMKKTCSECVFWGELIIKENRDGQKLHPDDHFAECRRFPPQRWAQGREADRLACDVDAFEFPCSTAIDWCGEFKLKSLAE